MDVDCFFSLIGVLAAFRESMFRLVAPACFLPDAIDVDDLGIALDLC